MRTRFHWGALLGVLALVGWVPTEAPVADAAMRGNVPAVVSLLESGADVNAAQGDGMTALHWAAEHGDRELAAVLLSAGADVTAVTRLGDFTALHIAARGGSFEIVRLLVDADADINARTTSGGVTPLHYAAQAGGVAAIEALLQAGADIDAEEFAWRQTPLMFAAAFGRSDAIPVLARAGAELGRTARTMDMDAREQQDRADQRRVAAVRRGEEPPPERAGRGAGSDAPTFQDINNQQRDRVPSSRYSHAQLVGGYGGLAPLHLAVREGHRSTAMALLDGGADIDQPSAGDRTTPLLMATINGNFDLAMELLERGADPNVASDANATPLYTVINTQWIPKARHPQPANYMQQQVTYVDLVRELLEAGVDPNVRLTRQLWFTTFGDDYLRVDRMGATPFWRAAYALDLPLMKLLVEHGADPNIPTMKGIGSYSSGGAT